MRTKTALAGKAGRERGGPDQLRQALRGLLAWMPDRRHLRCMREQRIVETRVAVEDIAAAYAALGDVEDAGDD